MATDKKFVKALWLVPVTLAMSISTLTYASASCAVSDPSSYNDISSIYFMQMNWTPGSNTESPPASLRAGNVIIHANARQVHLGGRGPNLGETIYGTTDAPVVVFDRLVTVLRVHRFYSMSSPSQSDNPKALTYTITVERCGHETTLSAVRLRSDAVNSAADIAFFRLLDDLRETTFKSPWTVLYSL